MVVARRMLGGGVSPEAVSEKLGFTSKYNFRREFLSFYGVRPLQFQKNRPSASCRGRPSTGNYVPNT